MRRGSPDRAPGSVLLPAPGKELGPLQAAIPKLLANQGLEGSKELPSTGEIVVMNCAPSATINPMGKRIESPPHNLKHSFPRRVTCIS